MKFFIRNHDWPHGLDEAAKGLLAGRHRHDVLEEAIKPIEADPAIDSVGYGGFPNVLGEMQLDAGFMNGDGRQLGAVGAVKNYIHPVSLARKLMERGLHTLLTGDAVELFAKAEGFTQQDILSPERKADWEREVKPLLDKHGRDKLLDVVQRLLETRRQPAPMPPMQKENFGTVVMLAGDGNGISAATSTSGWSYKHPGRLGDTPIAGAGFYADSRFGGCVCTQTGEMAMRGGVSRYVVAQLEAGKSVHAAIDAAIHDLSHLKEGVLRGLAIYAADTQGNMRAVAYNFPRDDVFYSFWREGMAKPETAKAERV